MGTNSQESVSCVLVAMDYMENGVLCIPLYTILYDLDFLVHHPKFASVRILHCADNQLVSLPEFPGLTMVYCGKNHIWPSSQMAKCGTGALCQESSHHASHVATGS